MNIEELQNLLAVLERARDDREIVHGEFRTGKDPVNPDISDILQAIAFVESLLKELAP